MGYRARQFRGAWRAKTSAVELDQGREILNPEQMELFRRMQARDQAHSLAVMAQIRKAPGDVSEDDLHELLVAALLHDVGKSRYPLNVWERVIIVLSEAMFPSLVERFGAASPQGWRKVFVIAKMHPSWGAAMAAEAGATPLAVELIRDHQNHTFGASNTKLNQLLRKLQAADNNC
jgi:putative nucleotidyltransferase with HDIG domain